MERRLVSAIGLLVVFTATIFQTLATPQVWQQKIQRVGINVRGAPVAVGQLVCYTPSSGMAVVTFEGYCISDTGDRVCLAASNVVGWSAGYGHVSTEAVNIDVNRRPFSHTRVYMVGAAGYDTYYAVAQNYYEQAGHGKATIMGTLTVKFFPSGVNTAKVAYAPVSRPSVNIRGAAVPLDTITMTVPAAGRVALRFDGACYSTAGDRIILAANNIPIPGSLEGNVAVEAANIDVNQNSFSHTRVYSFSAAGTYKFYAVAQNAVELDGSGYASIFGHLTAEYYPNVAKEAYVYMERVIGANVLLRGAPVAVNRIIFTPPVSGRILVRFDGMCQSSPGDVITVAPSHILANFQNYGYSCVEAVNFDVNLNSFANSRLYFVTAGVTDTFYAAAQNVFELGGSGRATVYGALTATFFPGVANHAVSDIQLDPASPAVLSSNDSVKITFDYLTSQAGGVRISFRPYNNGALVPGYSAPTSPLYPLGSGSGSTFFKIVSGAGTVAIDSIRYQMTNADQSSILLEGFIPVQYTYTSNRISNIAQTPPSPATLPFGDTVKITFNYSTSEADSVRIFLMPYTGGALTPNSAYKGSPVYAPGVGTGSSFFIVKSGIGAVTVDSIFYKMTNKAQTQTLLQGYIPVDYTYTSHQITNIACAPVSPATLGFTDSVKITFDYATSAAGGARIFFKPYTDGAATPNSAVSDAPLLAAGTGTGSASFKITGGTGLVAVDSIQYKMTNADQSQTLLEGYVPVNYVFTTHQIRNVELTPPSPDSLYHNDTVKISFDYFTSLAGGVRIVFMPFTKGNLTPSMTAQSSPLYTVGAGSGSSYFTITSGTVIVDSIRYQMTNADQSQTLLTGYIAVSYAYKGEVGTADQNMGRFPAEQSLAISQNGTDGRVRVAFGLPRNTRGTLNMYTIHGKKLFALGAREYCPGYHQVSLPGAGADRMRIPSGVYLITLETRDKKLTRKLVMRR